MHTVKRVLGAGFLALALATIIVVLPACQTVKGVGQDVKNAGEAGERAIDKATK